MWWERVGTDDFGRGKFSAPLVVRCRWDDVAKQFVDPKGETVTSRAIVYPDRQIKPGDLLKKVPTATTVTTVTTYAQLLAEGVEQPQVDGVSIFIVQQTAGTPNFRATEELFTAYL